MAKRETKYDLPKCGTCATLTRPKFPLPGSSGKKNTRLQHTRWRVCENGHQIYRKKRKR